MSEATSGHSSRAKDPSIVREAQKPIEFISRIFYTIALAIVVLALVLGVRGCRAGKKAAQQEAAKIARTHVPAPATPIAETLVLERECNTPCLATIAWPFKVIWGDSPLQIKYPGGQTVDRHGKDGDFQAPSFRSGEVKFTSLDPNNLHFRVQIYRVIVR